MKILYVYRYSILGGVSTQLANRLVYLKDKCEPHFVFLKDYGGRSAFGDYPFTYIIPSVKELAKFIHQGNFDIVIVIDTQEAYGAIELANFKGVVINEVHTTTQNIKYLGDLTNKKIDAFLAPSQYIIDRVENEFGYKDKVPSYVTSNCLDTDLFKPVAFETKPDKKIILWVGKLDTHKNWPAFLEIASIINERRTDCEFWMVGGETANSEIVLDLLETADDYELLPNFKWIQRVEYEDIPALYSLVASSGGLTISTTRNESFGMTIVESMACACPSIAPSVGAIPEILDGELKSNLYKFMDPLEAVDKIEQLLDSKNHRSKITEVGRKKVLENYTIDKVCMRYLNLLTDINSIH